MSSLAPFSSNLPLRPLKFVAPPRSEKVDAVPSEGEYLGLEQFESWTGRLSEVELQQPPEGGANVFAKGDVLFGKLRPYLAKCWAADRAGFCTTESLVLRPQEAEPRFLRYCLLTSEFVEAVNGSTYGSKMPRADWSFIGALKVPCPPKLLQERIANFLDEKTARIDALIAEKEALAALLNEYFSAQLGKTFTQGIHAGQTVSQTGIEWLPTAPTTWRICKFTSLATIVRGASPRPAGDERYFNGNYIPWVTVAELTKDENIYLNATSSSLTEEGAKFSRKIKSGTLIFSNSGATLGVPKILSIDACANDGVLAFENLSPSLNIIYAYYYLSSLTENLRDRIRQGAGQPNLNTAIVKGIAIPLPHPREQVEIVSFIRALDEKRRSLLTHVNEHINLLSEYRSSLISAAVIGQLNIDEFQARQLEAA